MCLVLEAFTRAGPNQGFPSCVSGYPSVMLEGLKCTLKNQIVSWMHPPQHIAPQDQIKKHGGSVLVCVQDTVVIFTSVGLHYSHFLWLAPIHRRCLLMRIA